MSKNSRWFVPALAAAIALGGVAPASAAAPSHRSGPAPAPVASFDRHGGGYNQGFNLRGDIAQLDRKIDRAVAMRRLSFREAASLRRDVDGLERLLRSYARGGIDRFEAMNLKQRIERVEHAIAREVRDFDGRNDHRDSREYRR